MREFIYKVFHKYIKRDAIYSSYKNLLESQYFDEVQLKNLQFQRLQKLLIYARENSPYYKELFKANNLNPDDFNIEEFFKLPFLSKELVTNNFENISIQNKRKFESTATSGTTGKRFNFLRDKESASYRQAHMLRFYDWMKISHSAKK
jgi:phenylacetate-CoA ligase